jgi:hypothetical protein
MRALRNLDFDVVVDDDASELDLDISRVLAIRLDGIVALANAPTPSRTSGGASASARLAR